ncbi:MAG: redoxin domain-containing protein [Pseudomonadota bacterium]|nr:redoxin domain-containing protein [Pseudomonadota bacterium]
MGLGKVMGSLRRQWRSHLGSLAIVAAVLVAAHFWQTRHVPSGPAPDFSALAVSVQDGAVMSLAQWRAAHPGRPVALHFWAEWCGVCRLEQHNITRVSADWPVLTVAMRSGDVGAVRRVLTQRDLPWATVVDPQGALARSYGLGSVPALVVVRPDGRVATTSVGYTTELGMRLRLWWAGW